MMLFTTIVHVIVCLMLILIILLQPGRGYGLTGSSFVDTSAQSVFGTKTADVLTKATTVAAILFMVTCIGLSALTSKKSKSLYSNFSNQAPITMNQIQKAVAEAQKKAGNKSAVVPTATTDTIQQKAVTLATKTMDAAKATAADTVKATDEVVAKTKAA